MHNMSPEDLRELRETFQRGLERIHDRLDSMDAKLAELPRLDERTQALRADIDRHDQCIANIKVEQKELRDRTSLVAKIGIGGGTLGGGGAMIAIIRSLFFNQ